MPRGLAEAFREPRNWQAKGAGAWQEHSIAGFLPRSSLEGAFRLLPGAQVFVFPEVLKEGMGVLDLDVSWMWYRGEGVGITAGARAGLGVAWGGGSSGPKLEPAVELMPFQVGVVF